MAASIELPIECVDNAEGIPGVVVYGEKTIPIPSQQTGSVADVVTNTLPQQGPVHGAGSGHISSVRPFQSSHYEAEETPMEWEPSEC